MAQFRTRARAVDMLGRQQIAGIPTAISELFKNAHDAYALHAIVDFFASDGLFVLRDDGVGMTSEEFEQRWLTLGTESRVEGASLPAHRPPGASKRPILGEKGIGRLAIAAIGPQVLVLSRAHRDDELQPLVAALLHWGVFELPGIDLDEVTVPLRELPEGQEPDAALVAELASEIKRNLTDFGDRVDQAAIARIQTDLDSLADLSPSELLDDLQGPDPRSDSGTSFFIRPSSPLIARDLASADEKDAPDLLRTLVGFVDTMTKGRAPALATAFRHHWSDESYEEVIGPDEFFTPRELAAADQHIVGTFDRYGQFDGTVSIYGAEPDSYQVAWQARGAPTRCGPFSLNLAYVQGVRSQSSLDPEAYGEIIRKLDRFGGLYIYRDDIRVLPYGNSDFDWLDVERRRSISASDAFFSYRRMFGAVEISRADNRELREKAGREGFSENEAYRQFRDILKTFLYRVAFDYFRTAGARSEQFFTQRAELERLDKARARRAKQVGTRRRDLADKLDAFRRLVQEDSPREQAQAILERLDAQLAQASAADDDAAGAEQIVGAEAHARRDLDELEASLDIRRPRGVGLTRELTRSWQGYEIDRAKISEDVIRPTAESVERLVGDAAARQQVAVDRRLRFEAAVEVVVEASRRKTRQERTALRSTAEETSATAKRLTEQAVRTVDEVIAAAQSTSARIDLEPLSDDEFVAKRTELEHLVSTVADEQGRALQSVTAQLAAITWPSNGVGEFATAQDELEALETDLERLRAEAGEDVELRQLGLAIEVINHEFHAMVRQIRRDLNRLSEWAKLNPAIIEPYRNLRTSFEHLDEYLRLFTPLHRRIQRAKVRISGRSVHKYLRDLFGKRLNDEKILLIATPAFLEASIEQYPSTIYPVFVNLVDNAIYWVTNFTGAREIRLDAGPDGFVVEDTGPGVPSEYREAIFEQGFSEKPGGNGLGLHIAREVLAREGLGLRLAESAADRGARFVITLD